MTTVGEILKNKRLEKKITLEQVEKATKIRHKFLRWIEENQFQHFQSDITAKGFVKNYASYLTLNLEEVMAFYRRQAEEKKSHPLPPSSKLFPNNSFKITPPVFTSLGLVLTFLIFLSFLIYQYSLFQSTPKLDVLTPKDNTVITTEEVEIKGTTDPDGILTINNQHILTKDNGEFQQSLPLFPGLNIIVMKVTNKYQKSTTVTRHIRLELP